MFIDNQYYREYQKIITNVTEKVKEKILYKNETDTLERVQDMKKMAMNVGA